MTEVERFVQYALAFEQALVSDVWTEVEALLAPDAVHRVRGGGPFAMCSTGRDAVVRDFRHVLAYADRRFEARIPEVLAGPEARPEGVWMRFRLTLRARAVPDLVVEGEHVVAYRDGLITRIDETVTTPADRAAWQSMATYDAALPPAPPAARAWAHRQVVAAYAAAKSRQDVAGALACCHDGIVLDTVPFGIVLEGRAGTAAGLETFFTTFPDYAVTTVAGEATSPDALACWGEVRMTMRGDLLGVPASGRTARLPFVSVFTFRHGLIARERFFFDLASLCVQLGVSTDRVAGALARYHGEAAA